MKTAGGIAAMGLVLVLVASTGVDREETPAPPAGAPVGEVDADGLPPRIEYPGDLAFTCEGLQVVWIEPDNADARVSAERGCLRMELALGRVDWPGGARP